jgi:ArsR family transcriptional regulator
MLKYSPPQEDVKLPPANLRELSRWLKGLAEPSRLRLLDLIIQGVQCNCELGSELGLAPNLISHHLSVLREIGLVNAERDPIDARWVYYSVNRAALEKLTVAFGAFFDPDRIQPRRLTCGPQASQCLPEALSRKS